jgi:plastocyanin
MRKYIQNKLAAPGLMALAACFFLVSCEKKIAVEEPDNFDVTADSVSYKAGSTVKFGFQGGEAHDISFYSGELLKDYEFRAGRVVDITASTAVLSFSTAVNLGAQLNQLFVMVSTDFKGDYSNLAAVKAATWTDVTARFKFGTSTTFLATSADVADLFVAGKPFYVAFKYVTKPQAVNGLARQWTIQSLNLISGKKLNNTVPLPIAADQAIAGFQLLDQNPTTAPALSTISTTKIVLQGNNYTLTNDPTSESWAVSTGLKIDKVNLGPDYSTPLKGMTNAALKEYKYVYTTPGTYNAVFIASNNSINESRENMKTIKITIN